MESMNIVMIILITTISLATVYALGHYVSIKNELFLNNSFAEWVIGAVTYFAITFVIFFPFVIIKVSISYFVIVFFIKEFLVWSFIVYKRNEILEGINYKDTIWIIISGIIIVIIYNFGIDEIKQNISGTGTKSYNSFSSWGTYEGVIQKFSKLSIGETRDWIISMIVASTMYATIASIFTNFIRANGTIERVTSLVIVLLLLSFMNFGMSLNDSLGIYLIFFSMLLGIRLIIYSRRRYGALFGILSFVIWTITASLLATIIVVALITIIIYTYRIRPKPSLFFVQLTMPLLMLISLEFYDFNNALSLILFFFSAMSYILILTVNNSFMERLNNSLLKYKIMIPTIILIIASIIMIIIVSTTPGKIEWGSLWTTTRPFFNFVNMPKWLEITQRIAFVLIILLLLVGTAWWLIKKKEFTKEMLFLGFVSLTILLAFNPLLEKTISLTKYYDQFIFLRILIAPPILMVGTTRLVNVIKNRIR